MSTITKRQKQIYDYIKGYIERKGFSPTFEEIKKHFKLSALSTVHQHIETLAKKGMLSKDNYSARSIELNDKNEMVQVPLLGTIAAGQPIEAIQEETETIAVPKSNLSSINELYALRVNGDSMIDENINNGDVIIVKRQNDADNGEKVVALIDSYEVTLKKIYKEKNKIRLQPANSETDPILVEPKNLMVQGVVIDIIKKATSIPPRFNEKIVKNIYRVNKKESEITSLETIRKILGKPYFEMKDCLIYNTDCIKAMNKIRGVFVDLTVTSPPYNIGKEYEENKSVDEYVAWCEKWMQEIFRITKENGSFWLNIGYLELFNKAKALPIAYLLWNKSPFYLIQEVIWNYGAGVAAKKFLSPRNEKLLWYVKNCNNYTFNLDGIRDKNVKYPNQKKNGKLRCNPLGKNPSDVWQIPKVTSGKNRSSKERTAHPAQFPEALIDRIVTASSNKKEVVFDPFLGSGTSAVVALRNNRKFVGIDILKDYCKITEERIKNFLKAQKQSKLF